MKKVYILGTGGTISSGGAEGTTTNYTNGVFDVDALIKGVPGLDSLAAVEGEQVCNVPSDDITQREWFDLARRIDELAEDPDIAGFVITHGTNTMEETAYFLNLAIKTDKPVVLTGAMRPATALSADGPMNIYQAVATAVSPRSAGRGVLAVMGDRIFDAAHLHKANAFRVDAFTGGDAGCVGYVQDDVPFFLQRSELPHTASSGFSIDGLTALPKVEIAYFYTGADPEILRAAAYPGFPTSGAAQADGLILAGAGAGFAGSSWEPLLTEIAGRIPVVRASRTMDGLVARDTYDGRIGTIPGYGIDPLKARILLAFALTKTQYPSEIEAIFKKFSGL